MARTMVERVIEAAAAASHEANRVYCQSLGDISQPTWSQAPDWQKESAMAGVCVVMHNPNITAKQQHEEWLRFKQADGWVYGYVKDPAAKTHPCMVPYDQLPEAQKLKDSMFGSVVRAVLTAMREP